MTLICSCLILLGLSVPSLWEDNPAWNQGATSPFSESILPTCALGDSWQKIPRWEGAAQQQEQSYHAGQKEHAASTLGPLAAGKHWPDVQITTLAHWFSGKSCRIWLKGPACNDEGHVRNPFFFSTHLHSSSGHFAQQHPHRQGPMTLWSCKEKLHPKHLK